MLRRWISFILFDRSSDTVRVGVVKFFTGIIFLTAFAFTLGLVFMILGVADVHLPLHPAIGALLERFF